MSSNDNNLPPVFKNTRSCYLCGFNNSEKLSYFGFPKNSSIRKLWAEFCKIPNHLVSNSYRLCNKHFTEDSFKSKPGSKPILKMNAVPLYVIDYRIQNTSSKFSNNQHTIPQTRMYCYLCGINNSEKLSYFRFPKDSEIRKLWIEFCKIPNHLVNNSYLLCNKHFTEDCFKSKPGNIPRLKFHAVPSLYVTGRIQNNLSLFRTTTRSCYLCGCNNSEKLSYFGFPTDSSIRQLWAEFCSIPNHLDCKSHYCLCNKHFTENSFTSKPRSKMPRLAKTAVPTVHVIAMGKNTNEIPKTDTTGTERYPNSTETSYVANDSLVIVEEFYDNVSSQSQRNISTEELITQNSGQSCSDDVNNDVEEMDDIGEAATCSYENLRYSPTSMNSTFANCNSSVIVEEFYDNVSSQSQRNISTEELTTQNSGQSCSDDVNNDVEEMDDIGEAATCSYENLHYSPTSMDSTFANCNSSDHSYNTKTSLETPNKKHKMLRYVEDFTSADMSIPMRATKFLRLAKCALFKQRKDKKGLQQKLRRAHNKIKTLKDLVLQLKRKEIFSENAALHLNVIK